jgi:hypothetical protein
VIRQCPLQHVRRLGNTLVLPEALRQLCYSRPLLLIVRGIQVTDSRMQWFKEHVPSA